jgi:hypothetical protein
MTRRERLEARADKRRDWAESRDRKSAAGFARAHTIADGIPMGQPVLVGHHSERHHRADLARIDSGLRAGCESADMAKEHRAKAAGIDHQLSRSIFSDDPDAIEAIEAKAARIDADAGRCIEINKAFRKAPGSDPAAKLVALVPAGIITQEEALALAHGWALQPWIKQPFPSYHVTNLRANARRLRERVKTIGARQELTAQAEAAGGCVVKIVDDQAQVTFAEKPEREILGALRAAGFWWSGGSWIGKADALPECVKALLPEEVQPCMSTPTP